MSDFLYTGTLYNEVDLLAFIFCRSGCWLHIRRMTMIKDKCTEEYAKGTERYTGGNF